MSNNIHQKLFYDAMEANDLESALKHAAELYLTREESQIQNDTIFQLRQLRGVVEVLVAGELSEEGREVSVNDSLCDFCENSDESRIVVHGHSAKICSECVKLIRDRGHI